MTSSTGQLRDHVEDEAVGQHNSAGLSAREREVLVAWLRADSKAEVVEKLHLSMGTINTYLVRARRKYGEQGRSLSTKSALFVCALQDGLISLDDW